MREMLNQNPYNKTALCKGTSVLCSKPVTPQPVPKAIPKMVEKAEKPVEKKIDKAEIESTLDQLKR